jgi:hypothetical protein
MGFTLHRRPPRPTLVTKPFTVWGDERAVFAANLRGDIASDTIQQALRLSRPETRATIEQPVAATRCSSA